MEQEIWKPVIGVSDGLYDGYYELVRSKVVEQSMVNRKFCNFVASNGNCKERNDFVTELSKYKKVDSGGRWMNNIGYAVPDKRKFQSVSNAHCFGI